MIAIKSNKELFFPNGKGFVIRKIDMPIGRPDLKVFELRIIDSCEKTVTEDGIPIVKQVGTEITRFKTITYLELDTIFTSLDLDMSDGSFTANNDELLRHVILSITQQECINGINGEPGLGEYYSEVNDWEIFRPTLEDKAPQNLNKK